MFQRAIDYEVPEGIEKDEQVEQFFQLAHKGHMPKDVARDMLNLYEKQVQSVIEAKEQAKEAEIDEAFREFAQNPKYKEISVNVRNLLGKIDPTSEILSEADIADLGVKAPKVAMLLNKIATLSGEDKVVKSSDSALGVGDREEQIQKIFEDYRAGRISKETANARRENINKMYFGE